MKRFIKIADLIFSKPPTSSNHLKRQVRPLNIRPLWLKRFIKTDSMYNNFRETLATDGELVQKNPTKRNKTECFQR